jgi:hypothetical protein
VGQVQANTVNALGNRFALPSGGLAVDPRGTETVVDLLSLHKGSHYQLQK